jgi:hypothetical protein
MGDRWEVRWQRRPSRFVPTAAAGPAAKGASQHIAELDRNKREDAMSFACAGISCDTPAGETSSRSNAAVGHFTGHPNTNAKRSQPAIFGHSADLSWPHFAQYFYFSSSNSTDCSPRLAVRIENYVSLSSSGASAFSDCRKCSYQFSTHDGDVINHSAPGLSGTALSTIRRAACNAFSSADESLVLITSPTTG